MTVKESRRSGFGPVITVTRALEIFILMFEEGFRVHSEVLVLSLSVVYFLITDTAQFPNSKLFTDFTLVCKTTIHETQYKYPISHFRFWKRAERHSESHTLNLSRLLMSSFCFDRTAVSKFSWQRQKSVHSQGSGTQCVNITLTTSLKLVCVCVCTGIRLYTCTDTIRIKYNQQRTD